MSNLDRHNTVIILDSLIISLFGAYCFVVLLGPLKAQIINCSLLSDYFQLAKLSKPNNKDFRYKGLSDDVFDLIDCKLGEMSTFVFAALILNYRLWRFAYIVNYYTVSMCNVHMYI